MLFMLASVCLLVSVVPNVCIVCVYNASLLTFNTNIIMILHIRCAVRCDSRLLLFIHNIISVESERGHKTRGRKKER